MFSAADITFSIGAKVLLRHATLELRPGELVALIGENGAGKSTLLNVMSGDLKPKCGAVTLNGKPLYLWPLRDRARMRAVLPQNGTVAFGFTALETTLLGRYPHARGLPGAQDDRIARAALQLTDVLHLANREMHTLSGGERARVMLARALAQVWEPWRGEARYLLLDEPTASLDLAHQHEALSLVAQLAREEGIGVLAVIHDLNLAVQYADRVVVLKSGCIAANGIPDEVVTEAMIEECFAMRAVVMRHPRLDCPLMVPLPR